MNSILQDATPEKRCSKCEKLWPATPEFFQRDRGRKDGLYYLCKVCCSARDALKRSLRKHIPDIPEEMKQCSKCEEIFPATPEFFRKDKSKIDGLYSSCKQCWEERYRKVHPKEYLDVPVPQGHKLCSKCRNIYPATTEYFYPHTGLKSGLQPRCKKCIANDRKAAYVPKPHPNITPGHKVCAECGKEKFASPDNFNRSGKNRFTHVCKACWKSYVTRLAKERAAKPQEPMRICTGCERPFPFTLEYFPPDGPCLRIRCRECCRKQTKANYKLNEEAHKAVRRKHDDANRELVRSYTRKRMALKKNAPGSHTIEDIKRQYERQKGHCYYCGKKLGIGKNAYHADHVIPLSRGGSNDISNIVIACPPCNVSKQNKLLHEWIEGGRLL